MSEFQVSNFEVFPPKCELLLFDTAQREDVSNQQGSFCLLWNTPEEEEEQLRMAKQLSLVSLPSSKLRCLTLCENMFYTRAFTGKCNRRYNCFNLIPIYICVVMRHGQCRFPIRNLFACFLLFYTSYQLQNFVPTLLDRNGSSSTGICGHVHVRSNDQRFHHRVSGVGCYQSNASYSRNQSSSVFKTTCCT